MTTQTVPRVTAKRPARTCSIDECARSHEARGLCHSHYERYRRGLTITGPIQPPDWRWRGDSVGYLTVHKRVYRARGPASAQSCVHCGGRARHWAYDHTDPQARAGRDGLYSTDVNRYMPLCSSCHKRFDNAHAAATTKGGE